MSNAKPGTESKIEALRQVVDGGDKGVTQKALIKALGDKSNFLVAKAAQCSAEGLHYELLPALVQAYNRFLQNPVKTDKTCAAERALCRALYELDYDNVEFYQRGLRYTQPEPVWGGNVDTAVDIRCTCALGLRRL